MKQPYLLVLCLLLLTGARVYGQAGKQDSTRIDSLRSDSVHTAESLLLQHQEQSVIDSIARQELTTELRLATGDAIRTKQLQQRLAAIALNDSLRKADQVKRIETLRQHAQTFPVTLENDTLFYLYARIGSFGPRERAAAITQRIDKLYRGYAFSPDSLRLVPTENGYDIFYNSDIAIMSISQLDALWLNTSTDSLAHAYYARISADISKERQANSLRSWLKRIALLVTILAALSVLIFLINKLFKRVARLIIRKKDVFLKGVNVRRVRILTPDQQAQFALTVIRSRTIKNEDITVPNSAVLSSSTINYSSNTKPEQPGLILHTTVTIGYDTPWKKMHQALLDAAARTEHLQESPTPFVLQTSLDDFFVSYQLNAYTREANKQAAIYSALHQNIQDCCNEAGIEIMSPHYHSVRDGNGTTIPADYLAKDYEAPPFRFSNKKNGSAGDPENGKTGQQ